MILTTLRGGKVVRQLEMKALFSTDESRMKTSELLSSFLVSRIAASPTAIRLLPRLLNLNDPIGISKIAQYMVKKSAYNRFYGGETLAEAAGVAQMLQQRNIGFILDYAVEGSPEVGKQNIKEMFHFVSDRQGYTFTAIAMKPSAFFPIPSLETLSAHGELGKSLEQDELFNKCYRRLELICKEADTRRIILFFDAEWGAIQPAADLIALNLAKEFNKERPTFCNTFQMYRRDGLEILKDHLIACNKANVHFGAKIVRGAYHSLELRTKGFESYVFHNIDDTAQQYFRSIEFLVDSVKSRGASLVVFATHNPKSSRQVCEEIGKGTVPDGAILLGQNFGMGDESWAKWISIVKYLPFGPIEGSVPYLMRRLEEDHSIMRRHSQLLKQQIISRMNIFNF